MALAVLAGACLWPGDDADGLPALEDYRARLGDLEAFAEYGELIFEEQVPFPDDADYRQLVSRYLGSGIEALTEDERRSLLLIAQLAMLANARTLEYTISGEDTSDGGASRREAKYQLLPTSLFALQPIGREVRPEDASWPHGSEERQGKESPVERVHLPTADLDNSAGLASYTWERFPDGRWTCSVAQSEPATAAFAAVGFVQTFAAYALGELQGSEARHGVATYRFRGEHPNGYPMSYWLDSETLWLREATYIEHGVTYTFSLDGIDTDIRIHAPDVDVVCEEVD